MIEKILHLCQEYDIQQGKIVLACDELTALNLARNCSRPEFKHSNITSDIAKLQSMIPFQLILSRVKGHQDKETDFEYLLDCFA